MSDQAEQAVRETGRQARRIANSRWFELTARGGYIGNGVVHLLIGLLVILLGIGSAAAGSEADQSGALEQIAAVPGGVFLLWVVAVGTGALTLRLIVETLVGGRTDSARAWSNRLKNAGKAVVYGVVCSGSIAYATGAGTSSSGSTRSAAAKALATPGGVFLLLLVAVVVVAIGVALVIEGARRTFWKNLVRPPEPVDHTVTVLGVVGYVFKGLAVVVVGVLVGVAAATSNPEQATGLDGAFEVLRGMPGGLVVSVLVGLGFVAFGVYSFFRAKYARL